MLTRFGQKIKDQNQVDDLSNNKFFDISKIDAEYDDKLSLQNVVNN